MAAFSDGRDAAAPVVVYLRFRLVNTGLARVVMARTPFRGLQSVVCELAQADDCTAPDRSRNLSALELWTLAPSAGATGFDGHGFVARHGLVAACAIHHRAAGQAKGAAGLAHARIHRRLAAGGGDTGSDTAGHPTA